MIIHMTRGSVRLMIGDRTVAIRGEAYARGYGSPDFVAYRNPVLRWDPPFDGQMLEGEAVQRILEELKNEFERKGMTLEIE